MNSVFTRLRANIVVLHDSKEQGDIRSNTPNEIQNAVSDTKPIKDHSFLYNKSMFAMRNIYHSFWK